MATTYPDRDTDDSYRITKGYYNEISHITRNRKKKMKLINDNDALVIAHRALANGAKRTGLLAYYVQYIAQIAVSWNVLWSFALNMKVAAIKYDNYVHERIAISRICREIINKNDGDKPSLIIMGSGNGSMTINNTRNSSAHGPIKRIIYELARLVPVIMADEYRTSKACNRCTSNLTYPKMHHRRKFRRIIREDLQVVLQNKQHYEHLKRHHDLRKIQNSTLVNRKVHGLCCCQSKIHKDENGVNRSVVMNRDNNSSKCIFIAARGRITGKPLPAFQH
jgi:hypothetical protein